MPYIIKKFEDGYKVCKKEDTNKCFSNNPLPLERAQKQIKAIGIKEGGALTRRQQFLKKFNLDDKSYSLDELSKISKIPIEILQEVYNRGIGAHKTNLKSVRLKGSYIKNVDAPPSQKLSKEQWAMARVYSFIDGNPKHDNDLREQLNGGVVTKEKIRISKKIKNISLEDATKDYNKLLELDMTYENTNSNIGNTFLDYFFLPYRLDTESKKTTFYDFLKNKDIMKKQYYINFDNYYKSKPNYNEINVKYNFFRLYFGAVSNFKPAQARFIYNEYKPTSILDFSSGWGGRLLGAMTIPNLKYTGFDTNTDLKEPYKKMIDYLKCSDRCKITFKDSSKIDYSKYDYDMVFTSPPYYTIEKYNEMPDYESYDDWNNKFLIPVISNTYKYLKNNGTFIININSDIYKDIVNIIGECDKKIPFKINQRNLKAKKLSNKEKDYGEYFYIWFKKNKGSGKNIEKINEDTFKKINKEENETEILDEKTYLKLAKLRAQIAGYDPALLKLSTDGIHKLEYNGVKFGREGYNDFIIYMYKAYKGEITQEEALKHKKNYLSRATKIKGNWKSNKESPNNLAINILW